MNFKIIKVANGFLVQPAENFNRDQCTVMAEVNVFNTWSDASAWLEKEFNSYVAPRR